MVRSGIRFRLAHLPARISLSLLCLLTAIPVVRGDDPSAGNWPEFRGPTGDGHSHAVGLPTRWSERENSRWKAPINDKGWSSPVIWERQVWLTTATADGKKLFAICVDRESGKIVHDIQLFDVADPAFCPPLNSYAS